MPPTATMEDIFLSFYVSLCWAGAGSGTQFIIFTYSALKEQFLIKNGINK